VPVAAAGAIKRVGYFFLLQPSRDIAYIDRIMEVIGNPRILVCVSQIGPLAELRRLLAAGSYEVGGHLLGSPDPPDLNTYQLILIESQPGQTQALELCRHFRSLLEDSFVPILYVIADLNPATRLASFEAGADTYLLRPFVAGELLAQVQALLRIKEIHDRLSQRTAEFHRLNKRLQQAYQQIDQELQLAQRIQASFLPQTLPQIPHSRFAVHYLLCGRVGGDFYDVFRLDENHVGIYVADAMGHGVPASLLTIFVKKGVRAKEVFGQQYRLVPPGEVLTRLNRDLIDQKLSESPFITMVYGLFNHKEGTICFARAGHPYPLHVPAHGEPVFWHQQGLLLGIADATFSDHTHRLAPGDKVLLYSDGIDNASFDGKPAGADSLLACAAKHRDLPVQDFVEQLARDLFGTAAQPDDLTLLGLEVCE
jgi:serine phosphatase RsbU (regulator of sigma subunit)